MQAPKISYERRSSLAGATLFLGPALTLGRERLKKSFAAIINLFINF